MLAFELCWVVRVNEKEFSQNSDFFRAMYQWIECDTPESLIRTQSQIAGRLKEFSKTQESLQAPLFGLPLIRLAQLELRCQIVIKGLHRQHRLVSLILGVSFQRVIPLL
ncbi:hypothetical protein B9Q13_03710 [Candidatus Marsarchaeota G2 archaeon ECH_B_SAG-G16]|uniref:Uncharacterized protein n=1 Tax=Candidatus Marsarchaeota G2 archaeon ECH_B_SAG-G16 TaxID=1978167 RepID=A0A2R6C1H2_9ARCH|nr:MAG: hypothetical protein B9Q13_03710 [Candidatus Marsarchaeota G2 archaeon ECH_B_SAG-G16]